MQRPGDELLVAFLDNELDDAAADAVAAWLARDPALRARLNGLCEVTILARQAFEPKPEAMLPRAGSPVVRFRQRPRPPRWWIGVAAAASAACFMLGVFIGEPGTHETMSLPSDVVRPDLKPWGLVYVGGRRLVSAGKPGFQFAYTTSNKELGPVTLFVTESVEPDAEATFDTRNGVNILSWRRGGHGYYIVGGANDGWLWNLHEDIAYQLKAM